MITIAVLALPGCVASSVAGALDIFALAQDMGERTGAPPGFRAFCAGLGSGPVAGFTGMTLTPDLAFDAEAPCDVVIVPALYGLDDLRLPPELPRALATAHRRGALTCAVCAGVFPLAEAGLLHGREATTHWNLADRFRRRFPGVRLTPERVLVDLGDVVTAGGVTAYQDLCLRLVARLASPELAAQCAKMLLADPGRRSQAPYAFYEDPRDHGDQAVLRAQTYLRDSLGDPPGLDEIARHAGLGVRTLLRRFRRATGDTPHGYQVRLRLEAARRLLETTDQGVDSVAWAVGYKDATAFRRLFKARTAMTPAAYRRRFSLAG